MAVPVSFEIARDGGRVRLLSKKAEGPDWSGPSSEEFSAVRASVVQLVG